MAGERFGVRNSGAEAVVEGAGDHCCEYMTGGTVVVLGKTGRNICAGMTGGVAFFIDEDESFNTKVNLEIVQIFDLVTDQAESLLRDLLEKHLIYTRSEKAQNLLSNWNHWKKLFRVLVPPSEFSTMGLSKTHAIVN